MCCCSFILFTNVVTNSAKHQLHYLSALVYFGAIRACSSRMIEIHFQFYEINSLFLDGMYKASKRSGGKKRTRITRKNN